MSKRLSALGVSTLLALSGLAPTAHAALIDTFSFSDFTGLGVPSAGISGEFTGTVEPTGLIEFNDLSAFQASVSNVGDGLQRQFGLSSLSLFSYDTVGGANSLGLIAFSAIPFPFPVTACIGAPSVLSPACNPAGNNPSSTFADILVNGTVVAVMPNPATVTLISSVNTPEPATWTMMLLGFAGLGFAGYRRTRQLA